MSADPRVTNDIASIISELRPDARAALIPMLHTSTLRQIVSDGLATYSRYGMRPRVIPAVIAAARTELDRRHHVHHRSV